MIQLHEQFTTWHDVWLKQQEAVNTAITSGDFSKVDLDPYLAQTGASVAPQTDQLDKDYLAAFASGGSEKTCADVINLQQQQALLEAFRRARMTRRTCRASWLRHAAQEAGQYTAVDAMMTQQINGLRKVPQNAAS